MEYITRDYGRGDTREKPSVTELCLMNFTKFGDSILVSATGKTKNQLPSNPEENEEKKNYNYPPPEPTKKVSLSRGVIFLHIPRQFGGYDSRAWGVLVRVFLCRLVGSGVKTLHHQPNERE